MAGHQFGGILLPTAYRSFEMDGEELGKLIRDAEAKGLEWVSSTPDISPLTYALRGL